MDKYLFLALSLFVFSCSHKAPPTIATTKAPPPAGFDRDLTGFAYPFPVKYFSFKSQKQDLRMAYLHEAPAKPNGKVVLLLHGKNFGAWYWEKTMNELLKAGYTVIAPDQIGFGKSTKPESFQYSFHELATNTMKLLQSLKVKSVSVVGHSMGGMLATRFALMYPEATKKLVLINPIGLEDWKTVAPYRSVGELYQNELRSTEDGIRYYQRMNYYAGLWKPEYEEMIEAVKGQLLHPDFKIVAWNSALTSDMIFTQPVVYEFPLLRPETLLIIGIRDRTAIGKDRVAPEMANKMGLYENLGKSAARSIPRAKLVELPGVGHMPQVEAFPEMMKALMDFL